MEALYEKNGKATVVPATAGTIVPNLPEGEEVKIEIRPMCSLGKRITSQYNLMVRICMKL
jgi:hypothetical protein